MEQKSVNVATIEAIPKLAWPIFAVIALVVFYNPLSRLLDKATEQLQGGADVEIAGLKISLPRSSLPDPPVRIRAILPKLDQETLQYLLQNVGDASSATECYEAAPGVKNWAPDDFSADSAESRLVALGLLVRNEKGPYTDSDNTHCDAGSEIFYQSTYTLTRNYLIDIITSLRFGAQS